jgi:hypothetical protein
MVEPSSSVMISSPEPFTVAVSMPVEIVKVSSVEVTSSSAVYQSREPMAGKRKERAALSICNVQKALAGAVRGSLSLVSAVAVLVATRKSLTSPHVSLTFCSVGFCAVALERLAVWPDLGSRIDQEKVKLALGSALSTAPPYTL